MSKSIVTSPSYSLLETPAPPEGNNENQILSGESEFKEIYNSISESSNPRKGSTSSSGSDEYVNALEVQSTLPETMDSTWKHQRKHFFVLSEAGKPIYSRYGDEAALASLTAVMQAIVSFVADLGDAIRSIHFSDMLLVFLVKGPLILVGVTKGNESLTQLTLQLTYIYNQIISVLTLTQLNHFFDTKKSYDLRRMIGGSERLLDHLASSLDSDPSFMLSAIRVVPMSLTFRNSLASTIASHCSKIKNVVFAILLLNNHLVTLVRMKKYTIHPSDLHLLLNLVNASESFKDVEAWTPICLPKFNSSGFLHVHASYLSETVPICLLMLTVERDIFFLLSEAKKNIVKSFNEQNLITSIDKSFLSSEPSTTSLGLPEIRHFWYKSKTSAQFLVSKFEHPYMEIKEQLRIHDIYYLLLNRLHTTLHPLKFIYYSGEYENVVGWMTQYFEIYASFDPLCSKATASSAVNKLHRWIMKEENSLFVLSAPTF